MHIKYSHIHNLSKILQRNVLPYKGYIVWFAGRVSAYLHVLMDFATECMYTTLNNL